MKTSVVPVRRWQAGTRIADHELVRQIGSGAFGEVWLARSLATGRFRAVKIVERSKFTEDYPYELEFSGVKRFEEVSREHEGFIDILHVCRDEVAGHFAYIMEVADPLEPEPEFNPGTYAPRNLAVEIEHRGKLPPAECVRVGLALAASLAALHARQLVHRDLKPSNIVFVRGAPKLADVGLVTEIKTIPPDTLAGSPDYMDLQVHGTAAGDLYSLGKLLYVMATGRSPKEWPAWPETTPDAPEAEVFRQLEAICRRACHPERSVRYGSAQEVHDDLLILQSGHSFTRLKRLERLVALTRRWGAAAIVTLLLAGFGYFQWDQQRIHQAKLNERKVGSYTAYGSRALEQNNLLGSLPWFAEALRLDAANERNVETHRLRLAAVLRQAPTLVQMLFTTQVVVGACFAGQENQLITRTADGRWAVQDVYTARPLSPSFGAGTEYEAFSVNPAMDLAITADDGPAARLWDLHTGQQRASLTNRLAELSCPVLSRDGQWAAAISDRKDVAIWNLLSNTQALVLRGANVTLLHLVFSPDSQRIVASGEMNEPMIWDVATGKQVGSLTNHTDEIYCTAFSPDGKLVATASQDRSVRIWDAATGRELPPCLRHDDGVFCVEFSADGRRVVTAGLDFTARVWDVRTREQLLLLPHNSKVVCVSFSPQGRYLITATLDGTVRVWDLQPAARPASQGVAGFSGNGRRMVLVQPAGLRVVEIHNDNPLANIPFTNSLATKPLLSRDGASVVAVAAPMSAGPLAFCVASRWQCAGASVRVAKPVTLEGAQLGGFELSGDGSLLFAWGRAGAGVWDLDTGRRVLQLDAQVRLGSFDPAGGRIAVASSNQVQVWHLGTGRPLLPSPWLHHTRVSSIEWSPNGKHVATTCWNESFEPEAASLWDVDSGRSIGLSLQHRDGVCFAAFNHQGDQVITCSEDFTAILWKPTTGRQLAPPLRHPHRVTYAAFSQNDRWVATVCDDGAVRLWDCATGEPLAPPFSVRTNSPTRVQWLDDDRFLAITTRRGTFWVWKLPRDTRPVEDLVATAELLSAEQVYAGKATVPQAKEILRRIWEPLHTHYPEAFSLRP